MYLHRFKLKHLTLLLDTFLSAFIEVKIGLDQLETGVYGVFLKHGESA